MINAKTSVKLHNRFDMQLIDSRTGEVKQTAQAENTVLNRFYSLLGGDLRIPVSLYMGTGTGTPAPTDTGLFNSAFGMATYSTTTGVTQIERTIAWPTSKLVYSVTFPATSSYVGNLTEIGVYSNNGIITHAMLTDSEGNPISINKTELDILIVTVTLYLTLSNSSSKFIPFFPNGLTSAFIVGPNSSLDNIWGSLNLYRCATATSATSNFEIGASSSYDASTRTHRKVGNRVPTGSGNGDSGSTYYNAIGMRRAGFMRFPNTDVFPYYRVNDISVGIGDGSTQDFSSPLPLFVKDSDIVYKNGTALTRGTDYTIDNVTYKSVNPCVTAGNFANVNIAGGEPWESRYYPALEIPFTVNPDTESYNPVILSVTDDIVVDVDFSDEDSVDATIGRKVDEFTVTALVSSYSYSAPEGLVFGTTVEYSTDGETWQQSSATLTQQYQGSSGSSSRYYYSYKLTGTFEEIDAPYVRVTLSAEEYPASLTNHYFYIVKAGSALYKKGSPIHFNTAPADGDVITMSVQLDRPYKSSNYVLDSSMSITLE